MKAETLAGIASLAVIALSVFGIWFLLDSQGDDMEKSDSIAVAWSPFESSGLFLVAEDRQFFARNGLNLTLYRSESGAAALDDMLEGTADLAVSVSEFPLVRKILPGTPARAVASIDKADYIYLVGRKDRGIENATDLRGKQIGTAAGSIAEFHLGRFLSINGMDMKDIEYVSVETPPETADAIVNGDLDAAVLAQPYADQARERLGTNATVWPAQSSQPLYALVVSTDDWIDRNPDEIVQFLRALAQAEEYMITYPVESKAIVQRELDLDPGYMDTVWQQNQYSLTLDQSLILAMEDEARWLIANNLTNATAVPDFRKCVYTKGLEEIKPGSVRIIG